MTRAVLLRAADRTVRSWKNGGGTTQDVAVFPADSDLANFGWRLSIADVAAAGPFSAFPGIDRHLAILSGTMALDVAGRDDLAPLTETDEALSFPGDVATIGMPIGGRVRDLNLMVRRGAFSGTLRRFAGPRLTTEHEMNVLVLRTAGAVTIDGYMFHMLPLDALLLPPGCDVRTDGGFVLADIVALAGAMPPNGERQPFRNG